MVVHFIERLHVQLVILERIGHAVVLPGRSDPESHDLGVPVDFTERAGGSPLGLANSCFHIDRLVSILQRSAFLFIRWGLYNQH